MGLESSERINRIALHPTNSDIAYVAALGSLWSPNSERGVFRTRDGGLSWQRVLFVDETTGATDIKMDPSNPDKLFAGMWQFRRWHYNFKSGGPGSGMYVTLDGGKTWTERTEEDGLPKGELGRMAFSIPVANPDRVYALVEAKKSALLRSDDGGLQDNGSWRGPTEVWVPAGIRNLHWQEVGFGDGFDTIPDPENARAGYVMSQGGFLLRYDLDKGLQKMIRPAPHDPEIDLRFNWNAGFEQDPFEPATIYYGSQFMHKSTDRGLSWSVLSDDLTSNDPEM